MKNTFTRGLCLALLLCLFSILGFAQNFPVTGKVVDANGQPLAGVTVQVKGANTSVVSNADGTFQISAPSANATLVFSYVGFSPHEEAVNNRGQLNISMAPVANSLQDVVVVGYGTKRRGDVTGAIATVSSDKIKAVPVTNVTQALQGRVAGVDANMASFRPGAGATIRIRGNRSLGATNEPLFVVDGIPQSYNIDDINPLDIESMDVLKDASATAIYGVRGANGVIQITTKKGRAGRISVEYNGSYSIDKLLQPIKVFNGPEWAQYRRDAFIASKTYNPRRNTAIPSQYFPDPLSDSALFYQDLNMWESVAMGYTWVDQSRFIAAKRPTTEDEKSLMRNLGLTVLDSVAIYDPSKVRTTDWQDLALQTGHTNSHQISITGGSEKFRAAFSGSYFDQKGIEPGQDYLRYTFNQSADFRPNKIINIGSNLNYTWAIQNVGASVYGNSIGQIPLAVPYDTAGNLILFPGNDPQIVNPLNDPNSVIDEHRISRLIGSIFAEVQLYKGLKYRAAFGADIANVRRGTFNGSQSSVRQGNPANASYSIRNGFTWILDNIVNYDTKIGDNHALSFTLLNELQKIRADTSTTSAENLTYESQKWYSLQNNNLASVTGTGSFAQYQLLSYMGRVNYTLRDKYIFTMSIRNDNSSVFPEGHSGLWFPSGAFAWRVDAEPFMNNAPLFNSLKFRLGYGSVGNSAINPYQTAGTLTRSLYNWADNAAGGYAPGTLPLPDLTWERTNAFNIGLDFGIMNNRISGTIDAYQSNTVDQIQSRSIPAASGFTSVLVNLGEVRNKGIEISLSTVNINQPDGFKWVTDFMFSKNKEEIITLFGENDQDNIGNQWFLGWPIRTYYDYQEQGVFQYADTLRGGILADYYWLKPGNRTNALLQPGRLRVADLNGDTIITEADKAILGSQVPKWIGSFNSTLSYKNFDLGVYVYVRNGSLVRVLRPQTNGRQVGPYVDYWTPTNPTSKYSQVNNTVDVQTYWQSKSFESGSFVRVRSISLTYRLPKDFLSRYKINSASLYFNALNPFLWAEVDDVDPETLPFVSSYPSSSNSGGGPTSYSYRSYVFGLRIGLQ
jgi:TonB-dependent starch-binding outer membrane protein SusC